MIQKLKDFVVMLNTKGIPLPMARDSSGTASLTATFSWLSFATALLGQFGKFAGKLGGVDLTQANYLFLISLGAYLGRRLTGDKPGLDNKGN